MKRQFAKAFAVFAAVLMLSATVLETSAHARAGGGRSMGSRGSRSYSAPASSYRQSTPYQQQSPSPMPGGMQQPSAGGGFMRSMAGGIAGGLLGGMLFRGMAGAGGMGFGGGGIGLFDIVLLAGIAYLIYRMVKRRRGEASLASVPSGYGYDRQQGYGAQSIPASYRVEEPARDDVQTGLSHLRQMDAGFDENRFKDLVMDNFFRIQGGWMNRDLQALSPLLTPEMQGVFRDDVERLLREGRVNRLEHIAVRSVELAEVWQEAGQDFITTLIYANLLDYTTDENGTVVAGSKTEPVKFEEYWTFTRPVGNNTWRLGAISQK